jgi:hypothetical protein
MSLRSIVFATIGLLLSMVIFGVLIGRDMDRIKAERAKAQVETPAVQSPAVATPETATPPTTDPSVPSETPDPGYAP